MGAGGWEGLLLGKPMSDAIKYLRAREWTMGNGQCHECCGVHEGWHGHPCHMTPETIGHQPDCSLAAALTALGEKPLMLGEFKSDVEFESYISEGGFFGTREKTADGCPRYKAYADKLNSKMDKIIYDALNGFCESRSYGKSQLERRAR